MSRGGGRVGFIISGASNLIRAVSGTVAQLVSPFTTLWATKFTTTGTGTFSGVTLAAGEKVAVANGGGITFSTSGNGRINFQPNASTNQMTATSGSDTALINTTSIVPASGSGSFALVHLNPTISGTSTGTVYGVGIASVTNTLTGGFIKPLSIGTATTDLFTGYSEKLNVDTGGTLCTVGYVCTPALLLPEVTANLDCSVLTSASSTIASAGIYIKSNKLIIAHQCGANGTIRYLTITLDGVSCAWVQTSSAP